MDKELLKFLNKCFILFSILAAGLLIFITGEIFYRFKLIEYSEKQITVSEEGEVFVSPDVVFLTLGVESTAFTSKEATAKNIEKMNSITKEINNLGIEDKDIKTIEYNLFPLYDYLPEKGRTFKGYNLVQKIQIKVRDFSKVGEVIERAINQGANLASDLRFGVDDIEKYKKEAREKAIKNAQEKAEILSKQTGIKLKKVINIYEEDSSLYPPVPYMEKGLGESNISIQTPSIKPGENEIKVKINLVYQIK